jgi:hypothetical protein
MPAALRNYLQTEAGSAFVLVAAALPPLLAVNAGRPGMGA